MTSVIHIDTQARSSFQVPAYDVEVLHKKRKDFLVVIPVINEGLRLASLLHRMSDTGTSNLADILVVDGGSQDNSLECCFEDGCNVRTVITKKGPGKLGAQLRCAYAYALSEGYAGVITIDGNDKDDPQAIGSFIEKIKDGYDFVQGSRFIRGGKGINTPKLREAAIRLIHAPALSWVSGQRWTDTTQGYRGYSSSLLSDTRLSIFRNVFDGYELLAYLSAQAPRMGFRCIELPSVRVYPSGAVPTKIRGVAGNVGLLKILWRACSGGFLP